MKKRLKELSERTARAFRAQAEVTFPRECPTLRNDRKLAESMKAYAKELFADKALSVSELSAGGSAKRSSGSEDFSYISHRVPSVMLAVSAGRSKDGYSYPLHHPKVRFDEAAISYGCAAYAYCAFRWLEDHS